MYEDYEPEYEPEFDFTPHPEYQKRAEFVASAKESIKEFFRWRNAPFHFRQLQVLFETQYFHIATSQAIYSLMAEGFLQTTPFQAGANNVSFIVPSRVASKESSKEILYSHMRTKAKIIALYDSPHISKDLGDHFESLVKTELRANQLKVLSSDSNSYKDKKWTKSKANLDIIAYHPDGRAFGVQAKNELKPIEKDELLEQLDICQTIGVIPIFIVRYMPWSFVPIVRDRGGFVLTLGTQLWPLGYRDICSQIKDKLSVNSGKLADKLLALAPKIRTQWPIEVATEIPEDASNRLSYWINTGKLPSKKEDSPKT